jgi:hypothetical protein
MKAEKLAHEPWAYTLYRLEDGGVVLSVLCGAAALYELNIPLEDDTAAKAIADQKFLEAYASEIRSNPDEYVHHNIPMRY